MSKMHKTPARNIRFVIAAPKCSINTLDKAITAVFKLMYHQMERYNEKTKYYSVIKSF